LGVAEGSRGRTAPPKPTAESAAVPKANIMPQKKLVEEFPTTWDRLTNGGKNIKSTATNTDNNSDGNNGNSLGSSVSEVTGSAKQIRNITKVKLIIVKKLQTKL
jgi:hypothetical protein